MATLLVTLAMGMLEIGSAWSDYQSLNQASRSGARVVSQLGAQGEADPAALAAIEAALGRANVDVTRIVIFEADASGTMPAACVNATAGYNGGAHCNVYDANSLANLSTSGWWGSGSSCGSADGNWCAPTDRSNDLHGASYVGVLVEVERSYLTGIFGGGTQSMTEATVMRVEVELQ